jgi:hypothetical protein
LGFPPGWRKARRNFPAFSPQTTNSISFKPLSWLKPQGYEVDVVRLQSLLEALASLSYDAVLIDLNYTRDTTSEKEGLDLSDIVAMTAHS